MKYLFILMTSFPLSLFSQHYHLLGLGSFNDRDSTLTKTEIVGDTIFMYYEIYEPCFSAVYPPCKGHTLKFREVYLVEKIRRDTARIVDVEKVIKESVDKY